MSRLDVLHAVEEALVRVLDVDAEDFATDLQREDPRAGVWSACPAVSRAACPAAARTYHTETGERLPASIRTEAR